MTTIATHDTTGAPAGGAEPRPTVLFVDDEPGVLDGIRLALRQARKSYHFLWAGSVEEALEILDAHHVDVVVTDMRMPGANGADLLVTIRREHPHVVRFVLSGEAEPQLVMRSMLEAHRWLTKPCPREQLLAALADAVRYRSLHLDDQVAGVIAGADNVPSLPEHYLRIQTLLADPNVSFDAVAAAAETDPAITAKLLQLANSAFAGATPSTTVRDAVGRIGIVAVAQLALTVEVMRALDTDTDIRGFPPDALATYGSSVGHVASALARPEHATIAAVGGLLAHVGILLEASTTPGRLRAAYDHAEAEDIDLPTAERMLFGVRHTDLAGHLLSIWGLPSELVLAVAASSDLPDPDIDTPFTCTTAVQAAALIVQRRLGDSLGRPLVTRLDDTMTAALDRWEAGLVEARP
ncbi:MAG: HDOD domain-containing protein [Acidimicrobiales bacterium]